LDVCNNREPIMKWGAGHHWPPLATTLECGQTHRCPFG